MDATVAALAGSLIGGSAALAGTVFTNFVVLRTEAGRRGLATQSAYVHTLRERSGAAFAQFFIIVQAIEWITWCGDGDPNSLDRKRIKSYEEAVNGAYGKLLGAVAMTASLNLDIYEQLRPLLNILYDLESRAAVALREFVATRSPAATAELRICKIEAMRIRETLPPELNRIMELAETAASSRSLARNRPKPASRHLGRQHHAE